jgi:hypothetical protein
MTYTSTGSASYDEAFTREIRILRPDWFDNRAAALIDTRRKLLQMARNGEKRPRERSHDPEEVRLATALKRAIMKDPKFKIEIQAANPGWFR